MIAAGFGVAQEQFEIALVVLSGFRDGQSIVGGVGHAEAKAVGLNAAVACAFGAGAGGVDAGKQAAGRVAGLDVGRDAQAIGKLVLVAMRGFDAVVLFAVGGVGFAPGGVANSGLGHQVALIRGVDEHAAFVAASVFHDDGGDALAVFDDALAGAEVEARFHDHGDPYWASIS